MASTRAAARLYLFGLIFFISGIAGLIYEVVWERLLELYFGVTNVSITLIVSAYMAGLGLGSLLGGRLSNRSPPAGSIPSSPSPASWRHLRNSGCFSIAP